MADDNRPYVGYEVRVPAGAPHRGIATEPEQCLQEYREQLGPDAFIRILTPQLSFREARQWEKMLEHKCRPALNIELGWGGVAPSTLPRLR